MAREARVEPAPGRVPSKGEAELRAPSADAGHDDLAVALDHDSITDVDARPTRVEGLGVACATALARARSRRSEHEQHS